MRRIAFIFGCLAGVLFAGLSPAFAASCRGNPNALGTSRVITIDPAAMPRIGTIQYQHSLPLNDHEVVITFDDGPLAPYSESVLDALAAECVKATYFMVGRMAAANPELVRRIYNAGHAIGTHSQNHPLTFDQMPPDRAEREINAGIASVQAAIGDKRGLAPFFRIPGLLRAQPVEHYLAQQSIAVWSADLVADDWYKGATPEDVVQKAMSRLEASKGKRGVLLLHDVQPVTAMALPTLLRELKAKGYRIVQAVPAGWRPKMLREEPTTPVAKRGNEGGWPRVATRASPHESPRQSPGQGESRSASRSASRNPSRSPSPPPENFRAGSRDTIFTGSIRTGSGSRTNYSDAGWTRFAR